MKKLYIFFTLFFILCTQTFSSSIESISSSGSTITINTKEFNTNTVSLTFDEDSRLLFLELPKAKLKKKINSKSLTSKYVKTAQVEDYGSSVAIILQLNQNIGYKLSKSNNQVKLSFSNKNVKKPTIVIDAGHGGKDPGAVRGNYREKDIALAVSKHVAKNLSKDFNVLMTRNSDVFITLSQRPRMANSKKSKLFVSIHVNASTNAKANGVEVYYFSKKTSPYAERIVAFENSFGDKYGDKSSNIAQIAGELAYKKNQENSTKLAKATVDKLAKSTGFKNNKIHGANFAVLRGFDGPSMLVELGFLSNSSDRTKLVSAKHQKIMGDQISNAIREYFK